MAKTPITQARDVDAELVLQLNKFGSAADLRSQQAKLTGVADCTAQIALTSEEQETLRLWKDALQSAPEGSI
ncbi:hypothetical protein JEV20_16925 [Pseudomonas aeruginosa]|nr:hypothetical protein [Pseudomonas aeruginosa]